MLGHALSDTRCDLSAGSVRQDDGRSVDYEFGVWNAAVEYSRIILF